MRRLFCSLSPLAFVWFGIVVGISAIEAPAKFRAPSLTRPVALDVGRSVFGALNRVEIVLAVTAGLLMWLHPPPWTIRMMAIGVGLLLLVQSAWLLPGLNARVAEVVAGRAIEESWLHAGFAWCEGIKLVLLFGIAWLDLKRIEARASLREVE